MNGSFSRFLFVWLLAGNLAAVAEQKLNFFRSNGGVTVAKRPLPGRLDSPDCLRWRVPIDSGHSTPTICRNRIFLTTYNDDKKEVTTVALEVETGKTLWKRLAPATKIESVHRVGSPAAATPACDGQRIYAFFGSYGFVTTWKETNSGSTRWDRFKTNLARVARRFWWTMW